MPIYWRCPECRNLISISRKKCSCGATFPPPQKRKLVVRVKYKSKMKSANAETLAQAREIEVFLKEELIRENYLGTKYKNAKNSVTFKTFLEKYYISWVKVNLKHSSYIQSYFNNWIIPVLGKKKINDITATDVEKIKEKLLSQNKSPRTVQHVLALLKASLNKAKDWDLFHNDNPVNKVKIPKFDNKRVRFLSHEEAHKLLEECKKRNTKANNIYLLVLIALTTGMRAGELFNLKWQDIDFENDLIYIRDPKSGSNRTAFLEDKVKKELLLLKSERKNSDYVFTNSLNQPLKEVPKIWKTIVKKLKFNENITDPRQKVVFHTLRHTFCSWLAMEGVPLHVIKELAGHKTIQMTERYSHLMPDIRKNAVKKIWQVLKKNQST